MSRFEDSAYSDSWQPKVGMRSLALLCAALVAVPLAIGLVWGTYLDDSAYVTFGYARNLATGRGLTYNLSVTGQQLLRAPLYALALWFTTSLGVPLSQAGLVLSVLGWGAAAVAVYNVGGAIHRVVAAVVAAVLVALNPLIVSTLGTEASWVVALTWIAVAASKKKRSNVQSGALVLMLCVHFDWITLATALLLLIVQWVRREGFPLGLGLFIAIAALGWEALAARGIVAPLSRFHWGLAEWGRDVQQTLGESEVYWLFLPLFVFGVWERLPKTQRAWRVGLPWCVWAIISIMTGGAVAKAVITTLGLVLAGVGAEVVSLKAAQWIEKHNIVSVEQWVLILGLAVAAGSPLGIAQASSLLRRYQFRPVVHRQLEQEVGEWLRGHTESGATVFGSQRVGYFADRAALPWDGTEGKPEELATLLASLTGNPPEYCVSFRSLAWDLFVQTGWFRHDYVPLQEFESAYDATSPLTVWAYRPNESDLDRRGSLSVHLPRGVDLIGYEYGPEHIRGGDTVHVTLHLQPTRPITSMLQTAVVMSMPQEVADQVHWKYVDMYSDRSIPVGWWQVGQVVSEWFELEVSGDIPVGAYRLDVSVLASDSTTYLPMYQDEDTLPLDRVMLGYVVVPWEGNMGLDKRVDASFGDEISLLGFETVDSLSPGTDFEVVLYWEARESPKENYVVFVHLLDVDGEIVASHDGPPMERRYPTGAWFPGDVVPDVHRLVLDSSVPVGEYQLRVGMYRWPDLDRLPVWDGRGVEQADRALVLQSVRVQ